MERVSVVVLAGQSNAERCGVDSALVNALAAQTDRFEFVKVAQPGSSLASSGRGTDWDPDSEGEMFDELLASLEATFADITARGGIPELAGLAWVHGEKDAQSAAATAAYAANFDAFVAALGERFDISQLRIAVSALSVDGPSSADAFRDAQRSVADASPQTSLIQTSDLSFADRVHYDAPSQVVLGGRLAEAIDLPAGDAPWTSRSAGLDVVLGAEDDVVIGAQYLADRIDSGGGDDRIKTHDGDDDVRSGAGDDRVELGRGDDVARLGQGDDRAFGGAGDDLISGFNGDDRIEGGEGNDDIRGGRGDDVAFGRGGDDRLIGGAGDDVLSGDPGADELYGGRGADTLIGDSGADLLDGGQDRDVLRGGGGRDTLFGGDMADRLNGGFGDDALTGGDGADVFFFVANFGADRITDFEIGVDRLAFAAGVADGATVSAGAEGVTVETAEGRVLLEGVFAVEAVEALL